MVGGMEAGTADCCRRNKIVNGDESSHPLHCLVDHAYYIQKERMCGEHGPVYVWRSACQNIGQNNLICICKIHKTCHM